MNKYKKCSIVNDFYCFDSSNRYSGCNIFFSFCKKRRYSAIKKTYMLKILKLVNYKIKSTLENE